MSKEFKIAKSEGLCHKCEQPLAEEAPIVALVRATGDELELRREDYHVECYEAMAAESDPLNDTDVMGVWRTTVPKKEEKKKLLIDDGMLLTFFEQLEGQDDSSRLNFRYVLTLILMRKRMLSYEGMEKLDDGREIWKMRLRGSDKIYNVIDTRMTEDQIAEVSASLGDIMQDDFEEKE
ncbi:MAG TPA: hypothetical protein PKK48_06075 [Phycisphaerae bacterium]|nr:hypothetical protein [Phycisphaerae bacterium]HPS52774.1 hypothetical protein [Phycisphaerae bacterium]